MILTIESKNNDKIKSAQKLINSSSYRLENREFFLEGVRLCCDAAMSGTEIRQCFITQRAMEKNGDRLQSLIEASADAYFISEDIASKLSDTKSTQGVFAVCSMPDETGFTLEKGKKYVALENIQDPSNLGAIVRTAEALGIDGAVLCSCCDPYNAKAQRAAMGSLLRLPLLLTKDMGHIIKVCKELGISALATVPDSSAEKITAVDMLGGVLAVIGNEGNGVSEETKKACRKVTIPMLGRAESLNASMAAAIVMWEMMR